MAVTVLRGTMTAKSLTSAPTLAAPKIATELNTGVDIIGATGAGERLAAMDGWGIDVSEIPAPGADSLDTPSIPGEITLGTAG